MFASMQIPVTLRPSRTRTALLFCGSLMFVILGVWMVREGLVVGYLSIGFFGLGLIAFGLNFHPRAAYLHLSEDGFTYCRGFLRHTHGWSDIQEFGVVIFKFNRIVAWNFAPDYPASRGGRAFSRWIADFEAALPDTYGMKAEYLAELMERLRLRYSAAPRAGSPPGA
ncbi:MAG: hypothetical protein IT585_01720 [candidate division Zixibacteria bacterium]|nr:hypothetical protein [candidate division Zixibacteria bacterium]